MKISSLLIGLLLGGLLGFGFTKYFYMTAKQIKNDNLNLPVLKKDTLTKTAKWTWADSLDAVKAAPSSHKIVYEDSSVRVLEVILDEHKTEPLHTHKYKSVMWFAQATPMVYYVYDLSDKNKRTIHDSINIPEMPVGALNAGELIDAEGTHAVKNTGNKKGIAYRIEFKKEFKP